jgi:hypothetical protein
MARLLRRRAGAVKVVPQLGLEPSSPSYEDGASPKCFRGVVEMGGLEPPYPGCDAGALPGELHPRGGRWRARSPGPGGPARLAGGSDTSPVHLPWGKWRRVKESNPQPFGWHSFRDCLSTFARHPPDAGVRTRGYVLADDERLARAVVARVVRVNMDGLVAADPGRRKWPARLQPGGPSTKSAGRLAETHRETPA